eukprot:12064660-Alexandrium_andersonii.AAC.1
MRRSRVTPQSCVNMGFRCRVKLSARGRQKSTFAGTASWSKSAMSSNSPVGSSLSPASNPNEGKALLRARPRLPDRRLSQNRAAFRLACVSLSGM